MSKVQDFFIQKNSGFLNNITVSDFSGVRTIVIVDKEVSMTDKEPSDTIVLTFNEDDRDNVNQIKGFAKCLLEMVGEENDDSISFAKWLFHVDNGDTHFDPFTEKESESIGFSPYDCIIDKTKTVEQLFKLWKRNSVK